MANGDARGYEGAVVAPSTRRATLLSGIYLFSGVTWILVTTWIASLQFESPVHLVRAEWVKGIAFMLASAVLLFVFSRTLFRNLERRAAEVERNNALLLEAERRAVAGTLAASLAHDSRNLLSIVLMGVPEASSVPYGAEIRAAAQQLAKLLQQLAELGRSTGGEPPRDADLGETVAQFVAIDRTHERLRGCTIAVRREPVPIRLVPVRIHQIVLNLLLNAADATECKGRIEVRVGRDGDVATLEVHDDGPGFAAAIRDRLLADVVTTKSEGTGVGLLSVRACAQRHHGDVRVIPSAMGGAAIQVRLRDAT